MTEQSLLGVESAVEKIDYKLNRTSDLRSSEHVD
jgi:hypothetical protein